jgi:hypothetical protein
MSGKRARLVRYVRAIWPTLTTLKEKCAVMKAHNIRNWNNQRLPWRGQAVLDAMKQAQKGVGE